ncbi:MAG TPA: NPCBM/NEW2 domain-containing protein [Candidatus Hydrogenedentes bacterium]|nr:NPCBM/NEW2 domain-containing protein [Candidatus Hydrogenedentota bacterium]
MRFGHEGNVMIGAVLWAAAVLCSVTPTPAEFEERDAWVDARFRGSPGEPLAEPGLAILANYDPVQRNVHMGKPLKLQDKPFVRGLFCHAPSMILVRIPSGGREFSAMVGVDTNDPAGEGSVVFSVHAGGNIVFRSDVLRKGMAAVPVLVDLQGATEFTLEISDAGDGNACDQSCWADAKIALADGKELWLDEMTMTDGGERPYGTEPFLSFVYDGRPSSEFLSDWTLERNSRELDPERTEHSVTYRDPVTNLVVRCVGVAWRNYPTVEWTAYFKNEGTGDTPILESIQAIDTTFERSSQGEFLLHHHTGDRCTIDSFEPHSTTLGPNVSLTFAPRGGRPTNFEWPYYNLECPQQNEGVIIVIAWPGQWASRFVRDSGRALRVVGGQELTRLRLHPGEEIRTPLIVLQFYKGDWLRAQNVWRRWMFEHNFPKDHGKALSPKHGAASVWYFGFQCTQEGDIEFIHRFAEKGIQLNYWWMDAGWYPGGSWPVTGTWEADKSRFPNGLRAVTDATREYGAETIVWFEVERVHPGTWLAVNRPEWVFGGADGGLLKMNEPEAVQWLTNHIDKLISDEGIDLYRSDFNIDPLDFWRGNDAADRQGITEIRYIEGYQAYWDELRRRHPGMLIDSCASGGRRDDLETMRRAVPLLRSDLENNPEAYQCHNYGFGLWLPYFDSANYEKFDPYYFRSTIAPFLQCNWDVRKDDFDVKGATERIKEWRSVAGYYFGDFWPLSDYSTADNVWMAWQLDRPDLAAGMVQAFRRAKCPYVSAQYKLRALEPDAPYVVKNIDSTESMEVSGQSLMENGLLITIGQQPDAVILTYEKAGK